MICEFNKAQLGVVMEKALNDLMLEIQKTQDDEITVGTSPGGFPYKLVITASGNVANLIWDHVKQCFEVVANPLPVTKDAGEVKTWERPGQAQSSEQEIKVMLGNAVTMFMGLPKERRPAFFAEVWKLISAEGTG